MTTTITLLQGDCLDLMAQIPDGSVDMVMADLPYGTTQNKWDSLIPLAPLWEQYRRICTPTAAIVLTASQPFTSVLVASNLAEFRHEWIWLKNRGSNFLNASREPLKEHESVLIFSRGKWTYNRQMQERSESGKRLIGKVVPHGGPSDNYGSYDPLKKVLPELRVPSSWQKFNTEVGKHPTQKPVALMEYLIRTYTNEGATVLDNTMGSGTTGLACVNLARSFIGIERDPDYFKIASERIAKAQDPAQPRLL